MHSIRTHRRRHPRGGLLTVLVLTLLVTACAAPEEWGAGGEGEAADREAELAAAQQELEAREAELADRERRLREEEERRAEEERLAAERAEAERQAAELEAREREVARREAELARQERARREAAQLEADRLAAERAEAERLERERQEAERAAADQRAAEQRAAEQRAAERAAEQRAAEEATRRVELSLRPGTVLEIEITETLSSETHRVGDRFVSRLASDVYTEDGVLAVPAGSEILGEVIEVTPLRRVGGQASIGVAFTELVPPDGEPVGLRASFVEVGLDRRKDKRKIVAGAIIGAVLGRVIGGKGAGEVLAGAAAGAAAGTAVVASKADGKEAVIPAGEVVGLVLDEVVTVTTEMTGVVER